MEIKTLENCSVAEITTAFNEAFRGYFIPLVFTEQTMAAKIKSEGIQLPYSVGAFDDGQLVGFILHGYDLVNGVKTIYNAGTGVIAAYRGKSITASLYQYGIPMLAQQGIHHHVLEVIDENISAKNIYQKIGFYTIRELKAYKGVVPAGNNDSFAIKEIENIPEEMRPVFEMAPSWQNSIKSVERDKAAHKIVGVFVEEKLVAFGSFVPSSGRVKHVFVLPEQRRKGIGTALLHYMQKNSSADQLVITNVDASYSPANQFLQSLGFQNFLGLYEMKMEVK